MAIADRIIPASRGVRADTARVSLTVPDALEPCMDGVAFAGEVEDAVDDLEEAVSGRQYHRALTRLTRLRRLVAHARDAFRSFAGRIDPRAKAA